MGFKWFVDGLLDGSLGFGGEESAGASFLRRDGGAMEHRQGRVDHGPACGRDHRENREGSRRALPGLTRKFGAPVYQRIDAPASPEQKAILQKLSPEQVSATDLAGEQIEAMLTTAPGNGAPIGGLKVVTNNGWFAARPSGTENVYKIYAESFLGEDHLRKIQDEAQQLISNTFANAASA